MEDDGRRDRGETWRVRDEPDAAEPEPDPLRPAAWGAVKRATVVCYDYLGLTLLGSLAAFLLGSLLWLVVLPAFVRASTGLRIVCAGVWIILLHPALAGPGHLAHQMVARDEPGPVDLLRGWRWHAGPALLLGMINGGLGTVLAGDLFYFATRASSVLRWTAVPLGYALLFWLLAQPYMLPLLILRPRPAARAARDSFLLAIGNPAYTIGIVLFGTAILAVSFLIWVPLMLITPVWLASIGLCATEALLRRVEAQSDAAIRSDREG